MTRKYRKVCNVAYYYVDVGGNKGYGNIPLVFTGKGRFVPNIAEVRKFILNKYTDLKEVSIQNIHEVRQGGFGWE